MRPVKLKKLEGYMKNVRVEQPEEVVTLRVISNYHDVTGCDALVNNGDMHTQ